MDDWPKITTTLLVLAVSPSANADRWQSLRDNNPFLPYQPLAQAVELAPPQLELRAVMVEGRATWFNVYNAETKQSAWVQQGDQLVGFTIKGYEREREALVLDYHQKPVFLALKQTKVQLLANSTSRATAMASMTGPMGRPAAPMQAAGLPVSEEQRLEQLADQIRHRREERRRSAG